MAMHCPECGCFMARTDFITEEEFDYERAEACGFDSSQHREDAPEWVEFHFVLELWECSQCGCTDYDPESTPFYYDAAKNNWSGGQPLTPAEIAHVERIRAENAGQLRMFA